MPRLQTHGFQAASRAHAAPCPHTPHQHLSIEWDEELRWLEATIDARLEARRGRGRLWWNVVATMMAATFSVVLLIIS